MNELHEDEVTLRQRFQERYPNVTSPVVLAIERSVLGTDYGASSWTTSEQAELFYDLLELGPGKRLLDIGAGAGWPGLYLSDRSGCEFVLTDPATEGLAIARDRARADGIEGLGSVVSADGALLPFAKTSFDAITHSDVLC